MDSVVLQICGSVVSVFSVEQKKVGCQQTFFCLRPFSVQVYFRPSVAKKSGLTSSNFFLFPSVSVSVRPLQNFETENSVLAPLFPVVSLKKLTDSARLSVRPALSSTTQKLNFDNFFWFTPRGGKCILRRWSVISE